MGEDMFNLEQSITDWRRQMLAAGIKTPEPLEELESHLRDDIERQVQLGVSAEQAFKIATQRMGPAIELKSAFEKVHSNSNEPMKEKFRNILVIIAGIAIAIGFVLPEIARWRSYGTPPVWSMAFLLISTAAFTVGAVWVAIQGLNRLARRLEAKARRG